MNSTKHNLSFNKAEIDYQALLRTSYIAFNELLQSIYTNYCQFQQGEHSNVYLHSFKKKAENLVIIGETLNTLKAGLKREDITIINKIAS